MDDIKAAIEDTLQNIDPSRSNLERSLRQGPVELRLYHGRMLKVLVWICAFSVALAMVGLLFGLRWLTPFALLFFVVFIPGTMIGLIVVPFLRKKRLDVSRAGIQIDHGNGRVDWYAFSEIQSIHLPRAPYVTTPFRVCMRDGRELRMIPSWERFDYVLDLLALGRPDLTGLPEFSKYRRACIAFDHIVSRSAQRGPMVTFVDGVMRSLVAGIFGSGLIFAWKSLSGAGVLWTSSAYRAFSDIFFICGLIWAIWLIAQDVILARQLWLRLEKDPNDVRRDRNAEQWLMQPFSGPSGLVFGLAVICSAVVTMSRTEVSQVGVTNFVINVDRNPKKEKTDRVPASKQDKKSNKNQNR